MASHSTIRHRVLLVLFSIAVAAASATAQSTAATAKKPHLEVYKSPTCGCCAKWVEHVNGAGFTSSVTNLPDMAAIKTKHGVPAELASCHTSLVGGYVIEGHVPAEDIRRLLRERPAIVGLAAPGMPAGSPGMDVPNSPAFQVLSFDKNGRTKVFATHPAR
ncbi:MAG: DUF411 domain-containing protein [Vicinamibacterales bacterium]